MSDDEFKEENGEEGLAGGPEGDEPMSFWEHFAELRSRLTKIVLGVVVGFVGSFMFAAEITRFLKKPLEDAWVDFVRTAMTLGPGPEPRPVPTPEETRELVRRALAEDGVGRLYLCTVDEAGAAGFLTKDTTPDFLLAAIRTVHSGHSVIAPAITNALLRDYTTPSSGNDAALADLSGRERDVFLLTAKGLGNAEIAASLVLSEATVKSHVGSILAKLKLKNRIQLVAFAYENNVLN